MRWILGRAVSENPELRLSLGRGGYWRIGTALGLALKVTLDKRRKRKGTYSNQITLDKRMEGWYTYSKLKYIWSFCYANNC